MNIYKLIIAVLSIFSIILLALSLFMDQESEIVQLITYYDFGLCFVFLYDFIKQFREAENKWKYFFTVGWLDLLSSIPLVEYFRAFRLARVFRVLRIIRSVRILYNFIVTHRKSSLYGFLVLFISFMVILSSILTLYFEQDVGNINSAEDALWWTFISVTTVGYGDLYPVTGPGRIAATAMIFAGLLAFGTIITYLQDKLNSYKHDPESNDDAL